MRGVLYCLCLAGIIVGLDRVRGDEPNPAAPVDGRPESERSRRLLEIYREQAAAYRFALPNREESLSLHETPVMIWMNAARPGVPRVQHGGVFVWTRQGRAEALGSIFSITRSDMLPYTLHELHSLATEPIRATLDDRTAWDVPQPGIVPEPVPDMARPVETRSGRLLQMRTIARRFTAHSMHYDETRWELNLLSQPLYRQPDANDEVADGAIFALLSTAGTDPEILLVIESRIVAGEPRWCYAVCRFTDLKTFVELDGKRVWEFANGSTGTYTDAGVNDRYHIRPGGQITKALPDE